MFSLGSALAGWVLVGLTQAGALTWAWNGLLKALIVVVLAGIGSGAPFLRLILGVLEAIGAIFMGPYAVALGLVIFLLILMFRPQGLFGKA
jgi:branched-chain amino acid transport system permease protein